MRKSLPIFYIHAWLGSAISLHMQEKIEKQSCGLTQMS